MQVLHLNERQKAEIAEVDAQMKPILEQLEVLQTEFQEAHAKVLAVKVEILKLKPLLVPLAEARADICLVSGLRNDGGTFEKMDHDNRLTVIRAERAERQRVR